MLYLGITAAWCLLALVGWAICRLAGVSDDAHAAELSELVARGSWRSRGHVRAEPTAEQLLEGYGGTRRATG